MVAAFSDASWPPAPDLRRLWRVACVLLARGKGVQVLRAGMADDHSGRRRSDVWLLLDSSGVGGIETHVTVLAHGLAAATVPVEVVFLEDHGPHPLRPTLDRGGIPHRNLGGTFASLIFTFREARPALVHTHGYKAGITGRLAAQMLGIPVVSTYHAGEPGQGRVRFYNAIDRATACLARPIAVSEPIRRRLPGWTRLIENFVEVPPALERSGGRPPTVAFVGRLSFEKGPDEFCALAEALPAISFAVYGDGPMRGALEAEYGRRVRFHGSVPSMAERWDEIGLLCMPSRHEGLPMATLEAMANGVPVAAYAVGALPQCIEHGRSGWLARPGCRAELAAAVTAWEAQDPIEAGLMADAARAAIARRFSAKAGIEKVLAVYEAAAGRKLSR